MQKIQLQFMQVMIKKSGNGEMAIPISQTTAYAFRDAEHAGKFVCTKRVRTYLYKIK